MREKSGFGRDEEGRFAYLGKPGTRAADPARQERKERLAALTQRDEWQLVEKCLNGHRAAIREKLAIDPHLTEGELRGLQAVHRVLTELVRTPVDYLMRADSLKAEEE